MPSIYEEDINATVIVISDIGASDSKVIVVGVKEEFNATNIVLIDAHQSTQRIAAEIVDFCVKVTIHIVSLFIAYLNEGA